MTVGRFTGSHIAFWVGCSRGVFHLSGTKMSGFLQSVHVYTDWAFMLSLKRVGNATSVEGIMVLSLCSS